MSLIVALEGASGVGKTTLYNKIREARPDWIYPPRWQFNRERDRQMEMFGNACQDFQTVMAAYAYQQQVIVVDRFLIGHYVYQLEKYDDVDGWRYNVKDRYHELCIAAEAQLERLHPRLRGYRTPEVLLLHLSCSELELQANREASGQSYPYNEAHTYRIVMDSLGRDELGFHTANVYPRGLNVDDLLRRLDAWPV